MLTLKWFLLNSDKEQDLNTKLTYFVETTSKIKNALLSSQYLWTWMSFRNSVFIQTPTTTQIITFTNHILAVT